MENQSLEFEDLSDELFCHTCNMKIQEYPSRFIYLLNQSKEKILLHYHFFFPCWDLTRVFQEYPHHEIISAGYICDYNMSGNLKQIRNLKQNLDLWD